MATGIKSVTSNLIEFYFVILNTILNWFSTYMIFKYPFKAFLASLALIILNGFNIAFAQVVQPPKFTYQTPNTYPTNSPITPLVPVQTGGAVPATIFGAVSTFAGKKNTGGYVDATGTNAEFSKLWGIDIDAAGNLYVSDDTRVRKITPGAVVTTLAGGNPNNFSDGTGTAAGFNMLAGLVVAPSGNIFVGDINNRFIREITPAGVVTRFAGTGINAFDPVGITADQSGNLFVADQSNDVIWKITPAGVASVYAGRETIQGSTNGTLTNATFNNPADVKFDRSGNLYVADKSSDMIREISTAGIVSTLAGTNTPDLVNGPLATALFNNPTALALDPVNNVYIADQYNLVIRMINQLGVVLDIAGNNSRRTSADGIGAEANFYSVGGMVYSNGVLFVTDQTCIREIIVTGYTIDKPLPFGLVFDSATGIISGTPILASPTTTYTITGYNQGGNSSSTVTITVSPPPPPAITYQSPQVYTTHIAITPLAPTNTGGAVVSYVIDKTLPAGLTFNPATGVISGTPTVVSPATDYKITASNDGGSNSFTINITVIAKVLLPQNITFGGIPVKTYGDADFDAGASSSNNTIPVTYTSSNAAVATIVNGKVHITGAGTSTITASQAANDNYDAANPINQLLTVNKATLTVTADNQTRPFGTANPPLTATYSGFVYNDTPTQLTELPLITTTAGETSPVGEYPITVSGGLSANYIIVPVAGTLTITAVSANIVIPNAFTPNGDGVNDLWNIKALIDYPHCMVSVYNRYGNLVYQSKGYAKPWDGTYNGAQVPVGAYYYIIDPKNGTPQLSGYVMVLR
jgi:gliding motility-associated-like protein